MNTDSALDRARIALEGLSIGDALGGFFEFAHSTVPARVRLRQVPQGPWHWTDDTQMAASVFSVLRQTASIDQDLLAQSFALHYERSRGYGPATRAILGRIQRGKDWREEAPSLHQGQGSFGNGGAMRVAPIGAFWAADLAHVAQQAAASAEITHAHPEAIAGAIAVAIAAALACQTRETTIPSPSTFLQLIQPWVPASQVAEGLAAAIQFDATTPIATVAARLGNGSKISAHDTVPFALWCAAQHLNNFEQAIWLTLEGLGDCDTTCAIVGGIVASYVGIEGIPAAWRAAREPLPAWAFAEELAKPIG
ncbi:ADP-ribosylglycohydrolase family protein [Herpetosiphon llansteffanensis]|uniref:ADP-ribosylglycohydrolase family protein n=1 Tax=Herpetosiphon llansteffanensis TaxID=2094568 RepID=UPI000D7C18A4|nr:ADP-ribosylglycohydrolase family protein [Herpetosiphon llansteffanensis]